MNRRICAVTLGFFLIFFGAFSSAYATMGFPSAGGNASQIQVSKTFPPDMASDVAVNSALTVEFGGTIAQSIYQSINFNVFLNGQPIDGELFYNPAAKQVMFKSKSPLKEGQTYTAQLSYIDGNGASKEKTWSFQTIGRVGNPGVPTVSTPMPIVQNAPTGGKFMISNASMGGGSISPKTPLDISFTEPIDIGSLRGAPVKLLAGKDPMGIDYRLSRDMKTLTLGPRTQLRQGVDYNIAINQSLTSASGTKMNKNVLIQFRVGDSNAHPSIEMEPNLGETPLDPPANVTLSAPVSAPASAYGRSAQPLNPFEADAGVQRQVVRSTNPLRLVAMSPQNGDVTTNLSQPIAVAFNEEIRPETLNEFTFRVEDDFGPIPAKIKYYSGRKQAVLTPVGVLDLQRTYRVIVTQGVSDLAGQPLQKGISATFSTRSPVESPEVPEVFAVSRVQKRQAPVKSQRRIQAQPVQESRELEVLDDESASNYEEPQEEEPLASRDVPKRSSKARGQKERLSTFKVAGIIPAANSEQVARKSRIMIYFNEPANPSTVNNINISVFGKQERVEGRVSYDAGNKRALFIPAEPLDAEVQYKVLVSDKIRSAAGEQLASKCSWQFSTQAELKRQYRPRSSTCEADAAFYIPLVDSKAKPRSPGASVRNDSSNQSFAYLPETHWIFKAIKRITQKGLLANFPFHDTARVSRYEAAMAVRSALSNLKLFQNVPQKPKLKVADLVELEYLVIEFRTELKSYAIDTTWFERFLEVQGVKISEIERRVGILNQRQAG